MTQTKFTAKGIRRFPAPDPSGQQRLYWDTAMSGFGVLCSGTSTAKTYVVRSRIRGRSIRKTFANAALISLNDARQRAKEMLVDFSNGKDPRAARTGEGVTLREALDTYLSLQRLKPRSREEMRNIF
jgi:hypothetical protein